jgi:DNA-binding transcriptional regulator/RsmH inhibitor MraZ
MFSGKFETTIDAKGRIDLSLFFLEELKKYKKYILAIREFDKGLSLYPVPLEKTEGEQITFSEPAKIRKAILSVPQVLRKFAKLKKEIVLIGCEHNIAILDSKIWEEMVEETKKYFRKISKTLKSLGL